MTTASDRMLGGRGGPWILLLIALLLSFGALFANRTALFYFDTAGYYNQGNAALDMILPAPDGGPEAVASDARPAQKEEQDNTTAGSRSMIYAIVIAALWRSDALWGVVVLNVAAVFLAAGLAARPAARDIGQASLTPALVAVPLIVASVGSLPFYTAYLMPDIFAPILLLIVATLTAFGRDMRLPEILLALALGALAVVVHPSHLAIAVLLLPIALIGALILSRRRWWVPPFLVLLLVLTGLAERKAFEFMAETVADKEVTYTPHVTARLIVDGPGLAYLDDKCPDPEIATCALHEALSWSDDPYRMTVSHIIFETSKELGSLRLLDPEQQRRIAAEQRGFFLSVLADRPFSTTFALLGNTLRQLGRYSIDMTIPGEREMRNVAAMSGIENIDPGRLGQSRDWIDTITPVQGAIYAASFIASVVLLIWPGQLSGRIRVLALMVLVGLMVNAFVCGAVSQPADRYGARVIWLLPFTAAFLSVAVWATRQRQRSTDQPRGVLHEGF